MIINLLLINQSRSVRLAQTYSRLNVGNFDEYIPVRYSTVRYGLIYLH